MNELHLYTISGDYTKFLYQFDSKVPLEHENTGYRKFVGVVLHIDGIKYFAPMSSPKPKHSKLPESMPDIYKICKGAHGIINLNNMIPVPDSCVYKVDIASEPDSKYRILLEKQAREIKDKSDLIQKKASKLYRLVCSDKIPKLNNRCCDYKKLETLADEYLDDGNR